MKFIHKIVFFVLYFNVSVYTFSFSWQNCGSKTSPIKIVSLDVESNANRVLYVTSKVKVAKDINALVQGNVKIYKKFFWGWTPIPCVEQFGSCLYEDVCALSPYKQNSCPKEFVKNNLPCTCPILEGQYITKKLPIKLKLMPQWMQSGTYKIKINLNKNNEELLCLLSLIKL